MVSEVGLKNHLCRSIKLLKGKRIQYNNCGNQHGPTHTNRLVKSVINLIILLSVAGQLRVSLHSKDHNFSLRIHSLICTKTCKQKNIFRPI